MGIKRFYATKDNTITNAFKSNLVTRATGSNMGEADVLEVFSIYGQATSASLEASRVLIDFSVSAISQSRTDGDIPASGSDSLQFFLKLYNTEHGLNLPKQYTICAAPVSQSWVEGVGLDMDEYLDSDNSNWINASASAAWTVAGGDFLTGSGETTGSQYFDTGEEDLEINITHTIEEWINNNTSSNGLGIFITASLETGSRSYYTKKFFARNSEFELKRPHVEARWNSSRTDDFNNFYKSSSLAPAADNLNKIYLYNYIRGQLKDIPAVGTNNIAFTLKTSASAGNEISFPVGGDVVSNDDFNATGSRVSAGVYAVEFAYTGSYETVYPVWHSASVYYVTGSAILIKNFSASADYPIKEYVTTISNLKPSYSNKHIARFRLFVRDRDWCPTIYTIANPTASNIIIESASYKLYRTVDDFQVIPYGTGSTNHTLLSYDKTGNYFDLDMNILEKDRQYAFKFIYNLNGKYIEQKEDFKFRVE